MTPRWRRLLRAEVRIVPSKPSRVLRESWIGPDRLGRSNRPEGLPRTPRNSGRPGTALCGFLRHLPKADVCLRASHLPRPPTATLRPARGSPPPKLQGFSSAKRVAQSPHRRGSSPCRPPSSRPEVPSCRACLSLQRVAASLVAHSSSALSAGEIWGGECGWCTVLGAVLVPGLPVLLVEGSTDQL